MLPYFTVPSLTIVGPLALQPFGVLVVTGILVGAQYMKYRGPQFGISADEMGQTAMWAVVPGIVFSHIFDVLFYYPERLSQDGILTLFKVWEGLSSYGGFLGALIGLSVYFAWRRVRWQRYADVTIEGLVLGWIFGRLGCTITHDHPGNLTDFFLAFDYPGGPRHNLGFYEFLYTLFVMAPVVYWIRNKKMRAGFSTALFIALYAPVRFGLDFLRATDKPGSDLRYAGLTWAQWVSMVVFGYALYLAVRLTKDPRPAKVA